MKNKEYKLIDLVSKGDKHRKEVDPTIIVSDGNSKRGVILDYNTLIDKINLDGSVSSNIEFKISGSGNVVSDVSKDDTTVTLIKSIVALTKDDLTGYATEKWVESKKYLTSHQDLSEYAKTSEVDSKISTAKSDLIGGAPATYDTLKEIADYIEKHKEVEVALNAAIGNKADKTSIEDMATRSWVEAKQYLTQHQSLDNYLTKTDAGNIYLPLTGGVMSNTNVVTNLNADMVDGKHDGEFTAAKLNTSHTIWGKSFNGTSDVSGKITIGGAIEDASSILFSGDTNNALAQIYENGLDITERDANKLYVRHLLFMQFGTGNVGVGTSAPDYKLHVAGNIYATGDIIGNNNLTFSRGSDKRGIEITKNGVIRLISSETSGYSIGCIVRNNDNTENLGYVWGVRGPANSFDYIFFGGNSYEDPGMVIKLNKNVGIGTTSPAHKLHVDGDIYTPNKVLVGDMDLKAEIEALKTEIASLKAKLS